MKKIRAILSGVLLTILMLVMASCNIFGASGVVGSYVGAIKKGDFEKATTYTADYEVKGEYPKDDEVAKYMYDKTVGAFKYDVKEESEDKDAGTAKIVISYEKYSYSELSAKMILNKVLNKYLKEQVDVELKTMEKKYDTMTITLTKNGDGNYKIDKASAMALYLAMQ